MAFTQGVACFNKPMPEAIRTLLIAFSGKTRRRYLLEIVE
jgi:hypothetical protein